MQERPTSVTVLAVVNMVLAGLSLVGAAWALVLRLGLIELPVGSNPAMALMTANAPYRLFTDVTSAMNLVATVLLLAASIGMLALRPWARLVTIGWGVYAQLTTVLGAAVSYALIFAPLLERAASGPEALGLKIGLGFSLAITLLYCGYCLLLILLLTRRRAVAAFAQSDDEQVVEAPPGSASGDTRW